MTLKRFFTYSIALHISILVIAISFAPAVKEKKRGGEFFTRLVSPEEFFSQVPFIPAIPKVRSAPHARPKSVMPEPSIEANKKIISDLSTSPGQGIEGRQGSKGIIQKPDKLGPLTREKLFDRSIIGDLAKREIEKEEKEKKDRTLTFNIKELRYIGYTMRLKERIESIWIYPPNAIAQGIYGDLIIEFTIKKNGRLGAVELIRTSGHKNLDDAAMKALRDGDPYWPLPDEWGMEAYTIEGHFVYTIYGYYIR
ncbi:MAG: energy transducer TonB [Nitrospirota bacterium]